MDAHADSLAHPRPMGIAGSILAAAAAILTLAASPSSAFGQLTLASAGGAPRATAPTFYADVLPILQENCQACHQPAGLNMGGMVAPMSLVTFEEVRPWAPLVAEAVRSGRMPPWSAAPEHKGTFVGERILEESEKETIIAWATGGTPAGDPGAAPPPPEFLARARAGAGGWFLGEPDLILDFDEPYCLADGDQDVYVNIPVQITAEMLPEDRWLHSIEYRNGPAVHHIIASVGGLVPGMAPQVNDDGRGRIFRAGPREVVFNMHFNKTPGPGTALCTNIQAGITFKKPGDIIRFVTSGEDLMMRAINIPAGEGNYSYSTEHLFQEDVEILSFMPHMHLRGKAALFELIYPDGRTQTLLDVPRYDFNWQHTYEFRDPVRAPAGSRVRQTLWWDNSASNPYNPDPTVNVRWGLPTSAEMSQGYMVYRRPGEMHLVVGETILADFGAAPDPADGAPTTR
jgi:hypothetical protein